MPGAKLTGEKTTLTGENLPRVGRHRKRDLKARQDLDLREREVFKLRRDGHTFQEIVDLLSERANEIYESTGVRIDCYSSISGVKKAFDRYLMRSPERFDLEGRKEELDLALRRAEGNYKYALERSRISENVDECIDVATCIRWSDVAGKWFDRIIKLLALTDNSATRSQFVENNPNLTESNLIAKLTVAIENSSTLTAPTSATVLKSTVLRTQIEIN